MTFRMNPDTRPGYRLVPRNSPAHGPDLHRYLNEAPDLCKSGLSPVAQPHMRSGRKLPFYWWRHDGRASLYAMKPRVAPLFRAARQNLVGNHVDIGGGDWSAAEITAVVEDYLAMLQADIAGQAYSKAGHRRALLPRLNPVRTAGAIEYKHQNISAAMIDLGLPYIRGYKPMSN